MQKEKKNNCCISRLMLMDEDVENSRKGPVHLQGTTATNSRVQYTETSEDEAYEDASGSPAIVDGSLFSRSLRLARDDFKANGPLHEFDFCVDSISSSQGEIESSLLHVVATLSMFPVFVGKLYLRCFPLSFSCKDGFGPGRNMDVRNPSATEGSVAASHISNLDGDKFVLRLLRAMRGNLPSKLVDILVFCASSATTILSLCETLSHCLFLETRYECQDVNLDQALLALPVTLQFPGPSSSDASRMFMLRRVVRSRRCTNFVHLFRYASNGALRQGYLSLCSSMGRPSKYCFYYGPAAASAEGGDERGTLYVLPPAVERSFSSLENRFALVCGLVDLCSAVESCDPEPSRGVVPGNRRLSPLLDDPLFRSTFLLYRSKVTNDVYQRLTGYRFPVAACQTLRGLAAGNLTSPSRRAVRLETVEGLTDAQRATVSRMRELETGSRYRDVLAVRLSPSCATLLFQWGDATLGKIPDRAWSELGSWSGGVVANPTGSGKTTSVIVHCCLDPPSSDNQSPEGANSSAAVGGTSLVVVPNHMLEHWKKEVSKKTHLCVNPDTVNAREALPYALAFGCSDDVRRFSSLLVCPHRPLLCLVSFAAVRLAGLGLVAATFRRVVVDEAHTLSSSKVSFRVVCAVVERVKCSWAVTATPFKHLSDLAVSSTCIPMRYQAQALHAFRR